MSFMEQALINGILALSFTFLLLMFFSMALRMRSIADRYRIKYGFDKDIELKEIDNPNNLQKREDNFKRRTFMDMESDKK